MISQKKNIIKIEKNETKPPYTLIEIEKMPTKEAQTEAKDTYKKWLMEQRKKDKILLR